MVPERGRNRARRGCPGMSRVVRSRTRGVAGDCQKAVLVAG